MPDRYFSTVAREIGIEGIVIPPRYTTEMLQQAAPIMYWGAAEVRAFGYNLPSRQWIRDLLDLAGVPSPARITSGGQEQMGYESAVFSRGGIRVLGILRLRDEEHPTRVQLAERGHFIGVRSAQAAGRIMNLHAEDVVARVAFARRHRRANRDLAAGRGALRRDAELDPPDLVGHDGQHGRRLLAQIELGRIGQPEVFAAAHIVHVLAAGGQWQGKVPTAANDQPGAWRVMVRDVISGSCAEAGFVIAEAE